MVVSLTRRCFSSHIYDIKSFLYDISTSISIYISIYTSLITLLFDIYIHILEEPLALLHALLRLRAPRRPLGHEALRGLRELGEHLEALQLPTAAHPGAGDALAGGAAEQRGGGEVPELPEPRVCGDAVSGAGTGERRVKEAMRMRKN